MRTIAPKNLEALLSSTRILLVDNEQNMRKVIRSLLLYIGVRDVYEVGDGAAGLEAIQSLNPDIVLLDWEMPMLNGREFLKMVRSPGLFSNPDIPIVMLSGRVERSRVIEAMQLGVNEYLRKPVSAKTLLERIVTIRTKPRPMVRRGQYYGPAPRVLAAEAAARAGVPETEFAWME
jgi:CheY-like chemotaxis protein